MYLDVLSKLRNNFESDCKPGTLAIISFRSSFEGFYIGNSRAKSYLFKKKDSDADHKTRNRLLGNYERIKLCSTQ